ncbi:hypothetical protein [Halomonas koreensis]|uniref:Heme exporter protein D n=1 Tax=Halomonas koreensis TaxID=245385 RepID=A0ABU1G6A2_9GAMM|nr:hypothetical protein [Halomonas koreensis]MDR5867964.1 hypothetical protein [Halomonas koreensis]
MNAPTDNFIQSLAQGGYTVALALLLCCLIVIGAFVMLGVWLERREWREQQRRLAESERQARRPIIGPHWSEREMGRR